MLGIPRPRKSFIRCVNLATLLSFASVIALCAPELPTLEPIFKNSVRPYYYLSFECPCGELHKTMQYVGKSDATTARNLCIEKLVNEHPACFSTADVSSAGDASGPDEHGSPERNKRNRTSAAWPTPEFRRGVNTLDSAESTTTNAANDEMNDGDLEATCANIVTEEAQETASTDMSEEECFQPPMLLRPRDSIPQHSQNAFTPDGFRDRLKYNQALRNNREQIARGNATNSV